jgi:large subunit ribosomal protein L28
MQRPPQLLPIRLVTSQKCARAAPSLQRTYATSTPTPAVTNPLRRARGGDLGSHLPKYIVPKDVYIPPYPYGDHALFKQANRGLYGLQRIQFGNNVSRKTETKTRRLWKPNVLSKSLYSVALKKKIKLRITAKVLKTMDREGGLDEYLLKDDQHRLKELGPLGWALRWTLMQKPEIVERMRAEAAALGIDQETIDEQWPTREMLAQQKNNTNGLVRAADLIGEETEDYDENVDGEALADEYEEHTPPSLTSLTKSEKHAMRLAAVEYTRALAAAQRYLAREWVDTEEEGLKLAFVRAKDRAELTATRMQKWAETLKQHSSSKELQEIRTRLNLPSSFDDYAVSKMAYNQWRRQQIDQVGSYEAWRANVGKEKGAKHTALVEEAGGQKAWHAGRKAMYAKMTEEAETAATNDTIEAERRAYLEDAINKADRAIRAKASGGEDVYAELTVEEMRLRGEFKSRRSVRTKDGGGDAWATLVNASNTSAESRPHA